MSPKHYQYKIGDYVIVNEKAKTGTPQRLGKIGKIHSYYNGVIYDYYVKFQDNQIVKFKETELDYVEG